MIIFQLISLDFLLKISVQQMIVFPLYSHITCNNIILLEDLAWKFNISTHNVAERIIRMIEMGNLNGIFDERGRFIQMRGSELDELASFIRKTGRISIADIASTTNQIFRRFTKAL